jgi:purine catabolism regulator
MDSHIKLSQLSYQQTHWFSPFCVTIHPKSNNWKSSMNDPILTHRELLRLCFAESVTWLSEQPIGDIRVHWVSQDIDEAQSGDLLLLSVSELTPGIISKASQLEVAMILILGEAELPELHSLGELPIAGVSSQRDGRDIYRELLTVLVNHRAYLMERGVRVHAQLSQIAAEGEGLAGLARAMSEISGRGILVQDKRLGILAEHPSSSLLTIWEDILAHQTVMDNLPEVFRDRKQAGQRVAILQQAIPGELERLVTPISVGGVARGYISLVDIAGSFDALDHLVAEQGALVCAVEMARAKAVREAEKRLKGDLLTALLQENLSPRDSELWVQSMGLDLEEAHLALRFAWDSTSPPSRRRLETLVNGEISRLGLKVIVRTMAAELVCFCQVPFGQGRPEVVFALGEAVLTRGAGEFPDSPVRCGIGLPAAELEDWNTSFRQAGQALEMARRLREHRPLYFPDLSVYRLLLQLEHHPELASFKAEILGPLTAHEGGEDLIRTLEAYFDCNGNLTQAAEALFIHRNTLTYRLERIAEITGLQLDETETRLAVQLALRIYRMTEGN